MINVTAQELKSILTTLDNALEMHRDWRDELHRTLICKLAPGEADLAEDAHRRCSFGRWFYSGANAHLRNLPSFKAIEALHEVLHNQARQLCVMAKGHWPITTGDYDPFLDQMGRFRSELLKLRQRVVETLHNIDAPSGAYNSALLLPELKRAQEARRRSGRPCSLLLLRFDLREVNRTRGRDAGDRILRAGVNWARSVLGPGETIYRYAGAEFLICLPGKSPDEAEAVKDGLLAGLVVALAPALTEEAGPVAVDPDPDAQVAAAEAAPSTTLNVHHGVVALEPEADIEYLIHQAVPATYTITI